jgi:hypothetical protein
MKRVSPDEEQRGLPARRRRDVRSDERDPPTEERASDGAGRGIDSEPRRERSAHEERAAPSNRNRKERSQAPDNRFSTWGGY